MTRARDFAHIFALLMLPPALCIAPTWLAMAMGW
jgi:hypothetical protein